MDRFRLVIRIQLTKQSRYLQHTISPHIGSSIRSYIHTSTQWRSEGEGTAPGIRFVEVEGASHLTHPGVQPNAVDVRFDHAAGAESILTDHDGIAVYFVYSFRTEFEGIIAGRDLEPSFSITKDRKTNSGIEKVSASTAGTLQAAPSHCGIFSRFRWTKSLIAFLSGPRVVQNYPEFRLSRR